DARPRSIRPSVDGLTFVCPGCGAEGRARIDQLDHQLCCTRCLARVYLDASGALVVGDRANTQPQAGRPRIPVPGARREPGQLEVLAAGWSRLTGPIGIAAGVVALLSVVGMARWATAGPDLPPTLDGRARYAAEAFVQDAAGRIRALATPGTSREAGAWMNLVRPHFARGSSGDVRIAVAIAQQDGKKATVRASIAVPGASAPADPRPSPAGRAGPGPGPRIAADGRAIELMLFWERDPRGEWRIDGARTFQSAVRSRFWAASGEALPAADPTGTGIPDASARPSERSGPASRRGPMGPNGDPTRGVKPAA
ncbi:MAG TPA: hypothetical protein VF590_14800, partial [Isosphaeraceae bacterium]